MKDKDAAKITCKEEEIDYATPNAGGGGMMYIPKIADKKNGRIKILTAVLKKISFYVKSIIFNQTQWVSRSAILQQIYILDNEDQEFSCSNVVTVGI